jgi:hypothetical protein
MAEPTLADLLAQMQTMAAEMIAIKADMASMKEKSETSYSGGADRRRADGPREQEFHPKHKKWDFPRFDNTSDPMLFLNKCDAYFCQHRTMAEERVLMASYHLDDVAQLWFTQLQDDDGTPSWGTFKDLLNLRFGPPLRSARCLSSPSAGTPGPWKSSPTTSRLFYPAWAVSTRLSTYSYTQEGSFRR